MATYTFRAALFTKERHAVKIPPWVAALDGQPVTISPSWQGPLVGFAGDKMVLIDWCTKEEKA